MTCARCMSGKHIRGFELGGVAAPHHAQPKQQRVSTPGPRKEHRRSR